eukprot:scaffold1315_cov405-Prasinococcus_capsulatus_cf.AAC.3
MAKLERTTKRAPGQDVTNQAKLTRPLKEARANEHRHTVAKQTVGTTYLNSAPDPHSPLRPLPPRPEKSVTVTPIWSLQVPVSEDMSTLKDVAKQIDLRLPFPKYAQSACLAVLLAFK